MDKGSADSSSSDRDNYLRHLNKLSHKISKPILNNNTNNKKPSSFEQQPQINNNPLQHQPPVYNINKNDFRDVVQKLTGSPAHDRISTPPPIQQPKQQSSRLQRIRPPPLPHITNRPPPLLNARPQLPLPQNFNFNAVHFNQSFPGFGRPQAPLSPLPPFPTVHAAAESPISAYMRDLQNFVSTMDSKSFSGFSPLPPPPPVSSHQPQPDQQQQQQHQQQQQQEEQEQQQENQPPPQQVAAPPLVAQSPLQFQMPSSPVPFGCLNSQLASYPLLSPGLMFSPNSANLGFPQLPLSPTVPAPSPRWREI
ncbi:VQ motif-containing protein 9 [Lathyrus oleraceus]|uniref:VQ domain-containing protein n=1 Tax=Pisum sativum TaxID=3888 RepID=A0A9D4WKN9_PEA|nr:VQ motif-containing protein 9 [Pisum sativum]KAI5404624.1 hypothetical protein KIW84_051689 [Pisum sativum]